MATLILAYQPKSQSSENDVLLVAAHAEQSLIAATGLTLLRRYESHVPTPQHPGLS